MVPVEDGLALHHVILRPDHRGDVLEEGSSVRDVEDLDTAADSEDGKASLSRFTSEGEFEFIATGVCPMDRLVGLLAVAPRFDVATPAEHDAVCLLYTSDAADDLLCVDPRGR